jgi:hypothetical protein
VRAAERRVEWSREERSREVEREGQRAGRREVKGGGKGSWRVKRE